MRPVRLAAQAAAFGLLVAAIIVAFGVLGNDLYLIYVAFLQDALP